MSKNEIKNLRDKFAMHAPITYEMAVAAFGCEPDLNNDGERAAFFAVWVMLRYECADAMLRARVASDQRGETISMLQDAIDMECDRLSVNYETADRILQHIGI